MYKMRGFDLIISKALLYLLFSSEDSPGIFLPYMYVVRDGEVHE